MEKASSVASFIATRIRETGKPQKDIAREAGFDKPNIITMFKQGRTKIPLAKVGALAKALETDPVLLFRMCMSEYNPDTWGEIEPLIDSALTSDELELIVALRARVGAPYLAALTDDSKRLMSELLRSMRAPRGIH